MSQEHDVEIGDIIFIVKLRNSTSDIDSVVYSENKYYLDESLRNYVIYRCCESKESKSYTLQGESGKEAISKACYKGKWVSSKTRTLMILMALLFGRMFWTFCKGASDLDIGYKVLIIVTLIVSFVSALLVVLKDEKYGERLYKDLENGSKLEVWPGTIIKKDDSGYNIMITKCKNGIQVVTEDLGYDIYDKVCLLILNNELMNIVLGDEESVENALGGYVKDDKKVPLLKFSEKSLY